MCISNSLNKSIDNEIEKKGFEVCNWQPDEKKKKKN